MIISLVKISQARGKKGKLSGGRWGGVIDWGKEGEGGNEPNRLRCW